MLSLLVQVSERSDTYRPHAVRNVTLPAADSLSYQVVDAPSHGTLSGTGLYLFAASVYL